MTEQVDFYVLNSASLKARLLCACRLTERAYLDHRRVVILHADSSEAGALDELLWTFSERSFVPHDLCLEDRFDPATPVFIGLDGAACPAADLLVNMTDRMPAGVERFARVAEIIDADAERRRLGRERFKSYRELKLAMGTHQVDEAVDP